MLHRSSASISEHRNDPASTSLLTTIPLAMPAAILKRHTNLCLRSIEPTAEPSASSSPIAVPTQQGARHCQLRSHSVSDGPFYDPAKVGRRRSVWKRQSAPSVHDIGVLPRSTFWSTPKLVATSRINKTILIESEVSLGASFVFAVRHIAITLQLWVSITYRPQLHSALECAVLVAPLNTSTPDTIRPSIEHGWILIA